MKTTTKYLQFPVKETEHRKLKLLCLYRGCTLKTLLQEMVLSCIENAPELKEREGGAK